MLSNIVLAVLLVIAVVIVIGAIKIVPQASAGITERLGKYHRIVVAKKRSTARCSASASPVA